MISKRSIAEQIAELSNPSPLPDPEYDFEGATNAKLFPQDQDDSDVISQPDSLQSGRIWRLAASPLEEGDVRYKGRRTSRKHLENDSVSEGSSDSDGSESSSDSEGDGGDLESFRELMQRQQPLKGKSSAGSDTDEDDDRSEEGDDCDGSENGSLVDEMKQSDDSLGVADSKDIYSGKIWEQVKKSSLEEDHDDNDNGGDDIPAGSEGDKDSDISEDDVDDSGESDAGGSDIEVVTKVNLSEEIEKGLAAKNQQGLWDNFLEARIKLQKALQLSNQLPQYTTHHSYIAMEDQEELVEGAVSSRQKLKKLLRGLMKLQDELLLQNAETKHIVTGEKSKRNESDEEIPSDDEGLSNDDEAAEKKFESVEDRKRKIDLTNPGEEIAKRHKRFEEYRNTVIHSWYDKTKLGSGKLNSKSFSALEKSPVEQVQQIMMDKERLVHRTQLKRSTYKVIGQLEKRMKDTPPDNSDDQVPEVLQTRNSNLNDVDPEIFDDDDFYHQLLKELIERKTADTTDPAQLTRQWLAVQKLRSKVKKVVDTRASKGRKLRYNIHPKMVSFMAPKDESTMTDEARNKLFSSLFGIVRPEAVR